MPLMWSAYCKDSISHFYCKEAPSNTLDFSGLKLIGPKIRIYDFKSQLTLNWY